jgi:hypothetical protein
VRFHPPPPAAAWRHVDPRDGFETVFLRTVASGHVIEGHTAAVEAGAIWAVHYVIEVDDRWVTQHCVVRSWSVAGDHEIRLTHDAAGRWRVDGVLAPALDGCLDIDLEASACTNMLPVRRAAFPLQRDTDAPAAFVRAPGLEVERLEQTYRRLSSDREDLQFEYRAPRFGVECELHFGADGLMLDYPGVATRIG